jgi:hypothetical protein
MLRFEVPSIFLQLAIEDNLEKDGNVGMCGGVYAEKEKEVRLGS